MLDQIRIDQVIGVLQWTSIACFAARVLVIDIMRVIRFIRWDRQDKTHRKAQLKEKGA